MFKIIVRTIIPIPSATATINTVFSFPINGRFIIWAAGRSHRGWITSSKPKTLPNRKPNTAEKNPQQEITAARSIFLTR